jgi:hypothetical protein
MYFTEMILYRLHFYIDFDDYFTLYVYYQQLYAFHTQLRCFKIMISHLQTRISKLAQGYRLIGRIALKPFLSRELFYKNHYTKSVYELIFCVLQSRH